MKILGISLRKPDFNEVTVAAFMATGLWLAVVGLMRAAQVDIDRFEAGALLLVVLGCVSVRVGIRMDQGHRHVMANLLVSAALLLLYQGAWAFYAV